MASKLYGKFNETGKPKTSLAKYLVEFNFTASNTVFEAVKKTLHITVCGQTNGSLEL